MQGDRRHHVIRLYAGYPALNSGSAESRIPHHSIHRILTCCDGWRGRTEVVQRIGDNAIHGLTWASASDSLVSSVRSVPCVSDAHSTQAALILIPAHR